MVEARGLMTPKASSTRTSTEPTDPVRMDPVTTDPVRTESGAPEPHRTAARAGEGAVVVTGGSGPMPPEPGPAVRARPKSTARPFIVQVAALRKQLGASLRDFRQGTIDGLAAVGVTVPDGASVGTDLTLSSYPGGIMATGTVTAPWEGECRRCGGPVTGTVVATVRERFAPVGESAQDEDAYLLAGDKLDLEPLARDAVLLDLPLAPLCSEECLGLCPRCGENWNVSSCACPPEGETRWSALDALRGPEGGSLA